MTTRDRVTLHHGDALETLRTLPDNSVDAVVTDPPYGLSKEPDMAEVMRHWLAGDDYVHTGAGFMGKTWDSFVPGPSVWRECLRALKPGGHLLCFAGSRTQDLMGLSIRLAGFEIRDSIAWLYGSGFPKSLDVSKAIDKQRSEDRAPVDAVRAWLNARRVEAGLSHDFINAHFGHARNGGGSSSAWMTNPTSRALPTWEQWGELKKLLRFGDEMDAEVWRLNGRKGKPGDNFEAREVLGERQASREDAGWAKEAGTGMFQPGVRTIRDTAPATEAAQQWQGWGTALKPSHEPVIVGRKPLAGTVAANVLEHGTGALNIDGCRVGTADKLVRPEIVRTDNEVYGKGLGAGIQVEPAGRWPTNVVLDKSQAVELDRTGPHTKDGIAVQRNRSGEKPNSVYGKFGTTTDDQGYGGEGGPSRFFPVFKYQAKAPTKERPKSWMHTCECPHTVPMQPEGQCLTCGKPGSLQGHSTVKPLELMRWLVRLVTPSDGVVLEPFAGSGATVEAALLEGFHCVAIEREADYLPLIEERIRRADEPARADQRRQSHKPVTLDGQLDALAYLEELDRDEA